MSKQAYKTFESNDSGINEIMKQTDDTMQKIKFQDQKKKFDAKIEELADQAATFYKNYGEEDWRTSLLVNFLDLSLQMKDIIDVVTAFNVANEILFHSMNLMNTSLSMTNGMMLDMGTQHNSPLKQKMAMRKAIKNNRNTVKSMIEQMKGSIEMASLTAEMYQDLSVSISGIMSKMNDKNEKKKAKAAKNQAGSPGYASNRGLDMVRGKLSQQGVSVPPPAPKPAEAPTTPPPTSGDSGLDGLL